MLYPTFNDLVALKHKASHLISPSGRKTLSSQGGDHASPFRGQGLEFEEVRHYAAGDDIRSIDWRVTARTGSPHTKVFREERERSVLVCLDVNETMRFGTQGTFKSIQAARLASLLGWQTILKNDKFGACLFGDIPKGFLFLSPQRSRKALWGMFKELCTPPLSSSLSPSFIGLEKGLSQIETSLPSGSLVYIISDFNSLNPSWEKQIRQLRKRCDVIFIPIDDPADQYIPPVGALFFSDGKGREILIPKDNQEGREVYGAHWLETRENLKQLATKLGIPLLPIATDADPVSSLFFALKHLKRGKGRK